MLKTGSNAFAPDYIVSPGDVLREILDARGMKRVDLASRCQLSEKTVSQILTGEAPVTAGTAISFERVLGIPAATWSNLEADYRLRLQRNKNLESFEKNASWLEKFPTKQLVARGAIERQKRISLQVASLLAFFGVGSIEAWDARFGDMKAAFRKSPSFRSSPGAVAAWLRMGEIKAQDIETDIYDKSAFRNALYNIRGMTNLDPSEFERKMKSLCSESGVALVFLAELPGTRLSGATRWLTSDMALILLSLRHKSDDQFWFSFFHEAAHILLHGKKQVFLDDVNPQPSQEEEEEANGFAERLLIPDQAYTEFTRLTRMSRADVLAFANQQQIAPGIVVGRLQHDRRIPFNRFNDLKRKFELTEQDD